MVPLSHSPPEPDELHLVLSRLSTAGIRHTQTQGNFLTPDTIWVEETDFERAASVLQQSYAEYSGNHARRRKAKRLLPRRARPWQVWRSSALTVVLALMVMVGTFAGFPLLAAFGVFR